MNHPIRSNEDRGGNDHDDETDDEFYSNLMELPPPLHQTSLVMTSISPDSNNSSSSSSLSIETIRSYAIQALALTVQDWNTMGQSSDPTVAETSIFASHHTDNNEVILDQCVHRVSSLFLVRIVAIVLHRQQQQQEQQLLQQQANYTKSKQKAPKNIDLSTSGICRRVLIVDHQEEDVEENSRPWSFLTSTVVQQMVAYVRSMLSQYATDTQLPYHNRQHAVSVVTNCNKLIEFILDPNNNNSHSYHPYHNIMEMDPDPEYSTTSPKNQNSRRRRPVITYGLRNDPLLMFALLFSALIHDVQHEGKMNSQLVAIARTTTGDDGPSAALLYNDQSIQEMRSLRVAFVELLKDDYTELRNLIFQHHSAGGAADHYRYFRQAVISAVLSTDLSSPERMAVSRSKWKEALFAVTSRYHHQQQQPAQLPPSSQIPVFSGPAGGGGRNQYFHRRASAASNESKPRIIRPLADGYHRRGSNYSEMSEITTDEGNEPFVITESNVTLSIHFNRRNSVTSEISAGSYQQQLRRWSHTKGSNQVRPRRRSSVHSDISSDDESSEVAADSVALMYNKQQQQHSNDNRNNNYHANNGTGARYGKDEASVDSIVSDTIDSYVLRSAVVAKVKQREPDVTAEHETLTGIPMQRRISDKTEGSKSFMSYPAGSIAIMQRRLEGAPKTRRRVTNNNDEHDEEVGEPLDETAQPINSSNVKFEMSKEQDQPPNCGEGDDNVSQLLSLSSSIDEEEEDDDDDDEGVKEYEYEYEQQLRNCYSSPPSKQIVKAIFPVTSYNNNTAHRNSLIGNHCTGTTSTGPVRTIARRASTGAISRFGSLRDLRIDENHSHNGGSNTTENEDDENDKNTQAKKSMNFDLPEIPTYRKRLGIRRSMDLSGEAIEFYPKRSSIGNASTYSRNSETNDMDHDDDEADYMKASAIIEALLRMADVGHFYQNWQNMTVWSARMFQERMLAEPNDAKRDEIYGNWFNNQILIIDSYLKPLAIQLDEAGVFGESNGMMFAQNVEEIRRHWISYGYEWSQKLLHGIREQP